MAITLDSGIFQHHWLIKSTIITKCERVTATELFMRQTNAIIFSFVATQMKFHGMVIDERSHAMQCVKCVKNSYNLKI
jgi:hypothetical protein